MWKRHFYFLLLLFFITMAAFYPSLHAGFTNWDDDDYIVKNSMITSLSPANIQKIFTTFYASNYHPFIFVSYSLEYAFVKLNPFLYHLNNVILHVLNSFLVYMLILKLLNNMRPAWFASLLFAIHPLHVESVAWVTERKDTLSTFFFLLSFIVYINFSAGKKKSHYILSILLFACALFSKPMVVSLPLILITYDLFYYRRSIRISLINKIPFLILAGIFSIIAIFAQKSGGSIAIKASADFNFMNRILFASYGFLFYLYKMVLPLKLSAFYPYPQNTSGNVLPFTFYFSFIILLGTGILFFKFRKSKEIIFGIMFYTIAILPVLQLIPVGSALTADRYFYIPSIGIFLVIAFYTEKLMVFYLAKNRNIIPLLNSLLILIFIGLSIITFFRCRVWNDSISLWSDVINKYPEAEQAWYGRGTEYFNRNENDKALADYNEALKLSPGFADVYVNRGNIYSMQGSENKAIEDFSKAIELRPSIRQSYFNRGNSYMKINDYERAIADYSASLKIDPGHTASYLYRGIGYFSLKHYDKALADFDIVLKSDPANEEAQNYRAFTYYYQNDMTKFKAALMFMIKNKINISPKLIEIFNKKSNESK